MNKSTKQQESYIIPGKLYLEKDEKLIEMGVAELQTSIKPRNKDFYMLFLNMIPKGWLSEIFELDFLFYLFNEMKNDNTISFVTDIKLAKKFNVCRQTIATMKQKLANANILKYGKNVIMINPNIIFKGGVNAKEKAERKYSSIKCQVKSLTNEELEHRLD